MLSAALSFCAFLIATTTISLSAQTSTDLSEPVRVGPGVTPPHLVHKVEPEYSAEARTNQIQGTVVFQVVVNEKGEAVDISVISPLGFGLDEQAQKAIAQWKFIPGKQAGVPVKILATVEVNFRFLDSWYDGKKERQRTEFNLALHKFNRRDAKQADVDKAIQSMEDLSRRKFPPAMHVIGVWRINGEHGPKDEVEGFDLIQKAADKNYGPALCEISVRRIDGRGLPRDIERGLREMREAATLGSRQAQFYLGNRYAAGDGVPRELDRARRYYRLCAAQGVAVCQYKLGLLLYDAPERRERDYIQAVALFQLAADQNVADAKQLASNEAPKLTAEQTRWVATLKGQIVRK